MMNKPKNWWEDSPRSKMGKNEMAKSIIFLQSLLSIKDKIILKQSKEIPLIDTDSNFVNLNKMIIIISSTADKSWHF